MIESVQNMLYLIAAGAILLFGIFALRFFLKFAWNLVRTAMVILSLLLIAGYLLGFLNIGLR